MSRRTGITTTRFLPPRSPRRRRHSPERQEWDLAPWPIAPQVVQRIPTRAVVEWVILPLTRELKERCIDARQQTLGPFSILPIPIHIRSLLGEPDLDRNRQPTCKL